ncbi:IS3 family transposase [Bacillus pseudomycoides]|uniref:IS3 family transposase n=1 Tax=Bacillus pseudomycoides TaxID=64104 RepID=A0AAJ3R7N2_9BACI|nr:IS3 family transposase [Bacillus pseudomycoides]MDR4329684.1 IS3 family transposase [Bacillus pseudomycoides]MED1477502.1 IS3 family transposase [Bacillus pseudomycoides]MED1538488.1 IS3 family transposase [Bacillus pseudomycoides]PEO84211.1 transposase [Bacillus pseudomycoides]PFZ86196.1 transposase [Bacillus pseudomycoides]
MQFAASFIFWGFPPSTYYYPKKEEKIVSEGRPVPGYSYDQQGKKIPDEQIQEWLMELIAGEAGIYGYRKLCLCLRNEYALQINKKKVYRLCKVLDILQPQREIKFQYPRKLAHNRTVIFSNQLWEMDIKYGYIEGEDRFFYVLSIINMYDRSIIDYHIGLHYTGQDAGHLVQRALFKRKQFEVEHKPVIRTDNGPQFISNIFEIMCQICEVEHERIPPKTPNMNAHIESFHRLLEYEFLRRSTFQSYAEAYQEAATYIEFYNNRRIHSSILDLSQNEFYRRTQTESLQIKEVRV